MPDLLRTLYCIYVLVGSNLPLAFCILLRGVDIFVLFQSLPCQGRFQGKKKFDLIKTTLNTTVADPGFS